MTRRSIASFFCVIILIATIFTIESYGVDINKEKEYLTRGQLAEKLVLGLGLDVAPNVDNVFTDIGIDDRYTHYILTLLKAGIIEGTSKRTFSPHMFVTREQLAVIYIRALGLTEKLGLINIDYALPDINDISLWARDSVVLASKLGIIGNTREGYYFNPGEYVGDYLVSQLISDFEYNKDSLVGALKNLTTSIISDIRRDGKRIFFDDGTSYPIARELQETILNIKNIEVLKGSTIYYDINSNGELYSIIDMVLIQKDRPYILEGAMGAISGSLFIRGSNITVRDTNIAKSVIVEGHEVTSVKLERVYIGEDVLIASKDSKVQISDSTINSIIISGNNSILTLNGTRDIKSVKIRENSRIDGNSNTIIGSPTPIVNEPHPIINEPSPIEDPYPIVENPPPTEEPPAPIEEPTPPPPQEQPTSIKLADIKDLYLNSQGQALWENVCNASYYELQIYKDDETYGEIIWTEDGEVGMSILEVIRKGGTGEYCIRIKAKGEGLYVDGDWSQNSNQQPIAVLGQIQQPIWNNKVISWNIIDESSGYMLRLHNNEELVEEILINNKDCCIKDLSKAMENHGIGYYTVSVQALGEGLYLSGLISEPSQSYKQTYTLKTVSQTNLSNMGIASWIGIDYGVNYRLELFKNGISISTSTTENNGQSLDILSKMRGAGQGSYNFKVTALGDGDFYFDSQASEFSNQQTVARLDTVTNVLLSNLGIATWKNVNNASAYKVYILKDGSPNPIIVEGSNGEIGHNYSQIIKGFGVGSYRIRVNAEGQGLYLDGFTSQLSNPQTVGLLAKVDTLKWDNNIIEWIDVVNGDTYILTLYNGTTEVKKVIVNKGIQNYDFTQPILENGPGKYRVKIEVESTGLYINGKLFTYSLDKIIE